VNSYLRFPGSGGGPAFEGPGLALEGGTEAGGQHQGLIFFLRASASPRSPESAFFLVMLQCCGQQRTSVQPGEKPTLERVVSTKA
jgi:hypothetical protein